jgi:anti-sigma regulatory factor (Ser/Thr protein kinase)
MMEEKLSLEEATVEKLDTVTAFVEEKLESLGCGMKAMMQVSVAVEEIYVNIAHYAYGKMDENGEIIPDTGTGPMDLILSADESKLSLTFIDKGTPYDPLAKEDPDTTLSAEERQIGGLGIFMVKKSMDDMVYKYEDGQNILTISKNYK